MRDDFLYYTGQKYDKMKQRFGPKYRDDGVTLRKPGREIPFTKEEFRAWVKALIDGPGLRCAYCERRLQVSEMEPDHIVPDKRGGALGLDNLAPACKVCNQRKGELDADEFNSLVRGLQSFPQYARNYILGCLGSAAMGKRNRFFPRKEVGDRPPRPPGPPRRPAPKRPQLVQKERLF